MTSFDGARLYIFSLTLQISLDRQNWSSRIEYCFRYKIYKLIYNEREFGLGGYSKEVRGVLVEAQRLRG
jgi:hypothetical protein